MRERLRNPEDLEKLREALQAERDPSKRRITICAGTGCGAYGCGEIVSALKEELKRRKLQRDVEIKVTGCHGFCERGPLLVINPQKSSAAVCRLGIGSRWICFSISGFRKAYRGS